MEGFRDGIEAAGAKRLATRDAKEREPPAAQRAEPRDGDVRVVRAARMKAAARAEERAQKTFVTLQHQDDDARHERRAPDRLCCEVCIACRRRNGFGEDADAEGFA
jgi:hypothetical protein